MTNNNNDNKNIKFTGDPVAFDGVEGKRDPKTGKGRFDLIPEEVFGPLFDRVHKLETTDPYTVNCTPASILNDIANENMLDAIIKITILKYYNTDSAIDAMCCQIEAGAFLECCWDMFMDLAIHFQKGAEHYGERNCQKGIPKWSFKDSAMRHASQTFAGKTDEPHTISVVWNCWLFVWSEIHERQEAEAIAAADKALEEMQAKRKAVKATILTGTRVPTLAEIEAAKSATPTPELKTMKLQAAPCAIGLDSMNHEDVKQWIETLKKFAEEHEFPIMTAIQHFYTREEVEAIKKEAADKAIEDFLKDREDDDYYGKRMTPLCRCSTDALIGELHKRLVVINKSENIVKLNFVTSNRETLTKLTHLIDSIRRCDVDSKTTVDTAEIQKIIHQLREEMRKAYNVFTDTDGKYVRVFFNQLRPGMNNMIAMWNSIALLLNNEKTPEQ